MYVAWTHLNASGQPIKKISINNPTRSMQLVKNRGDVGRDHRADIISTSEIVLRVGVQWEDEGAYEVVYSVRDMREK